jgi:hypothetical protein
MAAMTVRTVYVGERATLEQVRAAVEQWQEQTGDATAVHYDTDGDGYPGMGVAIDIYGAGADRAARRVAEGIQPALPGLPVAVEDELTATTKR